MEHQNFLMQEWQAHLRMYEQLPSLFPLIEQVASVLRQVLDNGGKVLLMGNGGSAGDSQHIAAEMVGRYKKERRGLAAIALTTDSSILTAVGNDYGYDYVFARQIEGLCQAKDAVIGISTSGNSKNVVRAIEEANALGAVTIALTGGSGGQLAKLCRHTFIVPSDDTPRIQEAHIFIGHSLCALLEA